MQQMTQFLNESLINFPHLSCGQIPNLSTHTNCISASVRQTGCLTLNWMFLLNTVLFSVNTAQLILTFVLSLQWRRHNMERFIGLIITIGFWNFLLQICIVLKINRAQYINFEIYIDSASSVCLSLYVRHLAHAGPWVLRCFPNFWIYLNQVTCGQYAFY